MSQWDKQKQQGGEIRLEKRQKNREIMHMCCGELRATQARRVRKQRGHYAFMAPMLSSICPSC